MKYLLALLAMLASTLSGTAVQAAPASEEEAYEIGLDAYTYGYPMVLMDTTRRVSTNTGAPGRLRAPMNDFSHMQTYPDATFKDVVRPNADTLYSSLWYDVGKEPLVLTLPKTAGRYHVVPIMDMWTEVFATLGTRTTGNDGGTVALVMGPDKVTYRVRPGGYLGQSDGRVTAVFEDRVELIELVPDGAGGWLERPATLALEDQ